MNARQCSLTATGILWLICAATAASADTCGDRRLVLDCPVSATKVLTVCIGPDAASYAFGPKGAPELELTRGLNAVSATAWPGIGRTIWENISFPNGDLQYEVNVFLDRLVEDAPLEGGVRVLRGAKELASLSCRMGQATGDVAAISAAYHEAGYCWDRAAGTYARDCAD